MRVTMQTTFEARRAGLETRPIRGHALPRRKRKTPRLHGETGGAFAALRV